MNTKVQNFSLVEGSRSRIVIKLPDGADPYSYTVTAGNDRCQQRHLQYEVDSISDHTITMLSEPAPSCMTIPYQLFITDNNSHVEWFVISGNVTVIRRLVGGANTESQDIVPPLSEQVLELNVTLEYSKADLDEAVALALGAASNAQQSAVDAGSSAESAWGYAACAHHWADVAESYTHDIGSAAERAVTAADRACLASGNAAAASCIACRAAQVSCSNALLAGQYTDDARSQALCAAEHAASASAQRDAACSAASYAEQAQYAACAAQGSACSAASTANTHAQSAQSYMQSACQYSSSAGQYAQTAQSYKESACQYADSACNAASYATSKADEACGYASSACQYSQSAAQSVVAACNHAHSACSAAGTACSHAGQARDAANSAWEAAQSAQSMVFAGPVWKDIFQNQTWKTDAYSNTALFVNPPTTPGLDYDLSDKINVCKNATAEIRIDYGTEWGGTEVIFPDCWNWVQCDMPECFQVGHSYRFAVRNESILIGTRFIEGPVIANLAYEYEK